MTNTPAQKQTTPQHQIINGVSEIADDYDYFILDVWGVLFAGHGPFPGAAECLQHLKDSCKKICLLSNYSDRASLMCNDLESGGISRNLYHHAVTAGESAYQALRTKTSPILKGVGKRCWNIASDLYMNSIIEGHGFEFVTNPNEADFIFNGFHSFTEQIVAETEEALRPLAAKQIPMLCSNPDHTVFIDQEQVICAGALAAFYETLGGHVEYHGKPYAPIYDTCMQLLGNPSKNKVIAVGDSISTDITGASFYGLDCIFNLSGIHREETGGIGNVCEDSLHILLESQPHKPNYVLQEFKW